MNYSAERATVVAESLSIAAELSALESWPIEGYQRAPYALGFLAVEFLSSKYGDQSVLAYWSALGDELGPRYARGDYQAAGVWQAAFQRTFGISVDDFYALFRAYRNSGFVRR